MIYRPLLAEAKTDFFFLFITSVLAFRTAGGTGESLELASQSPDRISVCRVRVVVALQQRHFVLPIRRDLNIFGTNIASERINAANYSKRTVAHPERDPWPRRSIDPDLGSGLFGSRTRAPCPLRGALRDTSSASPGFLVQRFSLAE